MDYKLKKLLASNVPESLHLWLISPAVHMVHFSSRQNYKNHAMEMSTNK